MRLTARQIVAFVLLVVGMFLLLEGSKLDPVRGEVVDMGMMGVGTVLIVVYAYALKDKLKPGKSSDSVLMPLLFVLGIMLVYQALTRGVDIISRALFVSLGAVLATASAFILYRREKK